MSEQPATCDETTLSIRDGQLLVAATTGSTPATLVWSAGLQVELNQALVEAASCTVVAGDVVQVTVLRDEPKLAYDVVIDADAMQATLTVTTISGTARTLPDQGPSPRLELVTVDEQLPAPPPDEDAAWAALAAADVSFGVDAAALAAALAEPGSKQLVAIGEPPLDGTDGYLEPLLELEQVKWTGVLAGTNIVRRVPEVPGIPGRDVHDAAVLPPAVHAAAMQLGFGVAASTSDLNITVAVADGAPVVGDDGRVEIQPELVIQEVGSATGDITFTGSVAVTTNVHEGRRVIAGHRVTIGGNVDRAHLESGESMEITGTIMSSTLRAGGDSAVAASILDAIEDLPEMLKVANERAATLCQAADERGAPLAFGHALQVILERVQRGVLPQLRDCARDLHAAGSQHAALGIRFAAWHQLLSTAANGSLGGHRSALIVEELASVVEQLRESVLHKADLVVGYMQASDAEATGAITLVGKGIFNSRVVAWAGLHARDPKAVVRGGTIVSHGAVAVAELGSPGAATMVVHLGAESTLVAGLVHAGTLIESPGGQHRFHADRSHVNIGFNEYGLQVESLAA